MQLQIESPIQSFDQTGGMAKPTVVTKRWGAEYIFINGDPVRNTDRTSTYCMKMIVIDPGYRTSMHFHVNKHESLMVIDGELTVLYKAGDGTADQVATLKKGEVFVVPPGLQHQLICSGEQPCIIVEASTPDDVRDSIRVHM